jgi:hypothetical protein
MEIKFNSRELSSVRHFEGKFCIIGIRVILHYSLTLSTQIVQTIMRSAQVEIVGKAGGLGDSTKI